MSLNRWSIALLQHPIYLGYVARLLVSGQCSSLSQFNPSFDYTPEERAELRAVVQQIVTEHGQAILDRIHMRPTIRSQGYNDMKQVLLMLSKHAESLSISLDSTNMENVLPPFIYQIDELLARPPFTPFGQEDARVLAMARWFKNSYMTWVDPIKCPQCRGPTESVGPDTPTNVEALDGGGRVELHSCLDGACGGIRRFVRYSKPRKLLLTREGRCGEWAHLFYCFLRYVGLSARYVWNSEDHVWAEYWSPALKHWVHVDPCEASTNKPLLYALGWGKKQAFCIAVGPEGAEDVTRAYVDDWHGGCQLRRQAKGWSEVELRMAILETTIAIRLDSLGGFSLPLTTMEARDQMQAEWMADENRRLEEARMEFLGGRTSGTIDWRAKREELGLAAHGASIPEPKYTVIRSLSETAAGLDILGDATRDEESVVLTSGSSQTSAVFLSQPVAQSTNLRVNVTFRLTAPDGSDGADGIAVVFAPEKKVGLGGYGMGYSGLGAQGDFAIEIDTFRTPDYAEDPPVPHISLHSPPNAHHRHSHACTQTDSIPYLSDGSEYTLELVYNASTRKVSTWLSHITDAEEVRLSLWEVTIPSPLGPPSDWFIGVTGSCGGLWQKQEILEWSVEEIGITDQVDATIESDAQADETMPNAEGISPSSSAQQ